MNFHLLHERLRRLEFNHAFGGHGRSGAVVFGPCELPAGRPLPQVQCNQQRLPQCAPPDKADLPWRQTV